MQLTNQGSSSNQAQDNEQTRSYMHAWRAAPGLVHSELAKAGERLEVNINVDVLDGATQRRELQVVQRQVGYLQLHLHAVDEACESCSTSCWSAVSVRKS